MRGIKLFSLILVMASVHSMATGQKTAVAQKAPYKYAPGQRVDSFDYSYLKFDTLYKYYKSKGINIVTTDNPDLFFEIFGWLNSPYCWGGKSKRGTDCVGFVSSLINKLYNKNLSGAVGDVYKHCDIVATTDLQEGDLLFFNISGRYLAHIGIYLQCGMFAHAASHGGVIISSMDEKYYKRWFYKAGRVKLNE